MPIAELDEVEVAAAASEEAVVEAVAVAAASEELAAAVALPVPAIGVPWSSSATMSANVVVMPNAALNASA